MVIYSETISNDLKELLQTIHHVKKVSKGQFLFQEGSLASELYMIIKGKVQVGKLIPDGRELTIRLCSAGEIVGELSLFSDNARHQQNAKMVEDGEVAIIFKKELEEKLANNSVLAMEFMKWITDHYRKSQAKFRDLLLNGKRGALFSTLIRLCNSYGVETPKGIKINLPLTNQELANFCGSSREVINRMLSDLKRDGIISYDKNLIVVHDIEYLRIEIGCENCGINICNIE
ncbi:MAG: Crp/Fnr family transcriptional regulator [Bacillales bacterium]|nr:Crp/Fnr family transcriptional regulator [Bacillales bacterium]